MVILPEAFVKLKSKSLNSKNCKKFFRLRPCSLFDRCTYFFQQKYKSCLGQEVRYQIKIILFGVRFETSISSTKKKKS